mmetsp:Transcript_8516/g.12042  ORF Transcript_8516/g.12042 Transcript_8516/m.12042 type:complete len:269 (-) Transcript_8516:249-1055(-)|eukprot:CAMPEP_0184483960 /NCGR_PEP_ID=MMETSP0113_2-20130426/5645_1 /TAXON_ID=91329 /ORGANISM="Norrisiella sphaerica, Strain BC52" /LENGTH=268 /DNA_ID=CAMNT_0026864663 /DNA_START=205 /DNA_END=1011 /DNA_ORIENTATION=-
MLPLLLLLSFLAGTQLLPRSSQRVRPCHGPSFPTLSRTSNHLAIAQGKSYSEVRNNVALTRAESEGRNIRDGKVAAISSDEPPKKRRGRPPGTRMSDESRRRIAAARKGKKWDAETRRKMSQSKRGRAHSPETIERMSEAHRGKRLDNSTRAKMSEKRQGHTHSPEVKERIRKSVLATQRKKKLMQVSRNGGSTTRRNPQLGRQALEEMRSLRAQMEPWIQKYRKQYGKDPTLESTRVEFPSLHQNMIRYNELVQVVKRHIPSDQDSI